MRRLKLSSLWKEIQEMLKLKDKLSKLLEAWCLFPTISKEEVVRQKIYHTVNRLRSFLLSCHHAIISLCHHVSMPSCHHVVLSASIFNVATDWQMHKIRTYRYASQPNICFIIIVIIIINNYLSTLCLDGQAGWRMLGRALKRMVSNSSKKGAVQFRNRFMFQVFILLIQGSQ